MTETVLLLTFTFALAGWGLYLRDATDARQPDAEPAVYATEAEGEVSVEGVAAALAELEGDE